LNEKLVWNVKSAPILVAGDVMVDEYVIGEVERISPESPVPVLVARDRVRRLGGAGNVVSNLVSLGGTVALFAAIGNDSAGRWFRNHCEEIGIETFWLKEHNSRPTTIKTRVVARNQQIVRIDEEHVANISPELEQAVIAEIDSVMAQVKAVVVSDYGKGFLTPGILQALFQSAAKSGVPVLVDPKGLDFSRYRGATYITPNTREASVASGIEITDGESRIRACRVLQTQTGAQGVVVTRGREGCTLVTDDAARDFKVKPVEIMDVTGAGDTFISAMGLAIANDLLVEDCVRMANVAASIVVARFGAAAVTMDEIVESLREDSHESKVLAKTEIEEVLRDHRIMGKKIVFTNGCFDLFHAGHLESLRHAASLGDVLVVGINSDKSVACIKGDGRPIIPQADRVELVTAFPFVDYAVVFDQDTPLEVIEAVRPDFLVKGEDWKGKKVVGEEIVTSRGGRVEFVRHVAGVSTTDIINKIRQKP
jgi:D-beta-D-heptose 7-phosphate kinase / D-beta-D-heptose 1-phosphate adenosyltransferase